MFMSACLASRRGGLFAAKIGALINTQPIRHLLTRQSQQLPLPLASLAPRRLGGAWRRISRDRNPHGYYQRDQGALAAALARPDEPELGECVAHAAIGRGSAVTVEDATLAVVAPEPLNFVVQQIEARRAS